MAKLTACIECGQPEPEKKPKYREFCPCCGQAVNSGYVYIMSNRCMPGVLKIGYTYNLQRRYVDLSGSTAVPEPFVIEAEILVKYPRIVEREVFVELNEFRVHVKKEYFRISPEKASEILEKVAKREMKIESANFLTQEDLNKIMIGGKSELGIERKEPRIQSTKVSQKRKTRGSLKKNK